MAHRIVFTGAQNNRRTVIRKDADTQEFIVQFFEDDEYLHLSDYFTPDWQDAHATATLYLERRF